MPDQNSIFLEWGPELPSTYGEDIIVALVRDPDCLVFYWDAAPENAQANLVARVQCLTRGTHFDVDLPAFRSAWHLAVESNMAYRLTLLCRTPDGGLKTLAVSQTVCPPVRHAWQAGRAPTELIQARRQPLTRRLPWTEEPAAWLTTASAAPGGAARPSASVGPPLTGVGPDSAALRPSWSRVNFGEGR